MAVAALYRQTQSIGVNQRFPPQIFIAHSSIPKKLLEQIKLIIQKEKVKPFFANNEHGKNIISNIVKALHNSDAFFLILTKKACRTKAIRDWISFEIGLAIKNNLTSSVSSQYNIFAWKDATITLPKDSPIAMITQYKPFKINSKKSREAMLENMRVIALNVFRNRTLSNR